MELNIIESTLTEAIEVLRQLPEFDPMLSDEHYEERIGKRKSQALVAVTDSKVVGCKIGYDKFKDGSFYSWLGGVLPEYRQLGVARALAYKQESWARSEGFKSIKFKTMNRHRSMILFAIKNGFDIYNVKPKDELENYRIEMIKDLL